MAAKILSMRRRTVVDDLGNMVEVYQVDFRTKQGAADSMRFPADTFDPVAARKAVDARAATLDKMFVE